MVKAIDFVVRTHAGNVQRGSVAGDSGAGRLEVGSGEEVSLNLSNSSVLGYDRQGNDLVVKLVDGREIVLSNYFENTGIENRLYLSNDSEVTQVFLADGGNGTLYANYGAVDTWSKYSTVDDLRFVDNNTLEALVVTDDTTVGMAPFIPALLGGVGGAGAGTAAAVIGGAGLIGGLAGGGSGGHTAATVDGTGLTSAISTKTVDPSIAITGTGQPGDTIVVTIGGSSQTTTITEGGTWAVNIAGADLPPDGNYSAVVTVTGDGYGPVTLDGPAYVIDMTAPNLTVSGGTQSTGHIENLVDIQDGVTINGQGEAGATIRVEIGSETQTTTVGVNGSWSVNFSSSQVATGEYSVATVITAIDTAGNETILTETLVIDTVANPLAFNAIGSSIGGHDLLTAADIGGAVTVTGSSVAGAVVTVTLAGASQQVTTLANGSWSVTYPGGSFAAGEYDSVLTATTVDAAGNSSSSSHTVRIDTATNVSFSLDSLTADNVINDAEAQNGVTLTGSAAADTANITVEWNGTTLQATVLNGQWEAHFPGSAVTTTSGTSFATVTTTDLAGNSASAMREIAVDRAVTSFALTGGPGTMAGDGYLNAEEHAQGLNLTGTSEVNSNVVVHLSNGSEQTAHVGDDGRWEVMFAPASLPSGELSMGVSVTATDHAGNVSSFTDTVIIDTIAPPPPDVKGVSIIGADVDGIRTATTNDIYDFVRVDGDGTQVDITGTHGAYRGTSTITDFIFNGTVPDGSYLVVNTADQVGNSSSTLLIVDTSSTSTVDLARSGLDNFDISTVDLSLAPAQMTITPDQLTSLTGPDNTLLVKGAGDDTVTLTDASATGHQIIDGQGYGIYTLGTHGATVLLDDDIQAVI